jgi:hypothetical protein
MHIFVLMICPVNDTWKTFCEFPYSLTIAEVGYELRY